MKTEGVSVLVLDYHDNCDSCGNTIEAQIVEYLHEPWIRKSSLCFRISYRGRENRGVDTAKVLSSYA